VAPLLGLLPALAIFDLDVAKVEVEPPVVGERPDSASFQPSARAVATAATWRSVSAPRVAIVDLSVAVSTSCALSSSGLPSASYCSSTFTRSAFTTTHPAGMVADSLRSRSCAISRAMSTGIRANSLMTRRNSIGALLERFSGVRWALRDLFVSCASLPGM
jgi:hypothetical protein